MIYRFKHFAISSISIGFHVARGADVATVSITAAPNYIVEQSCVTGCLYGIVGLPFDLGCSRFASSTPNHILTDLWQVRYTTHATVRRT
jgi:hypothetical protein